jgi:hypothetical protein
LRGLRLSSGGDYMDVFVMSMMNEPYDPALKDYEEYINRRGFLTN